MHTDVIEVFLSTPNFYTGCYTWCSHALNITRHLLLYWDWLIQTCKHWGNMSLLTVNENLSALDSRMQWMNSEIWSETLAQLLHLLLVKFFAINRSKHPKFYVCNCLHFYHYQLPKYRLLSEPCLPMWVYKYFILRLNVKRNSTYVYIMELEHYIEWSKDPTLI